MMSHIFSKTQKQTFGFFLVALTVICLSVSFGFAPKVAMANDEQSGGIMVVGSNTEDRVAGFGNAILTYSGNLRWTANIAGASWIWKTYLVENPLLDEEYIFTKDFYVNGEILSAQLTVAADNSYVVSINDTNIGGDPTEFNYFEEEKDMYNVATVLRIGNNNIKFRVKNWSGAESPYDNPAGLLYRLEIKVKELPNSKPVIALLGGDMEITIGAGFSDPGATATDTEDGDITSNIVKTGSIDNNILGSYILSYNVTDSKGAKATEVKRTVTVKTNIGLGSGGGGGGGGGGSSEKREPLVISGERVEVITSGIVSIKWTTNLPASSRVVYDRISHLNAGDPETYGYAFSNLEDSSAATTHEMLFTGLQLNKKYFFRPISHKAGTIEVIGKELEYAATPPPAVNPPCNYLLEYLKFGADNNPVEVKKLQTFLRDFEGFSNLEVTGIFDQPTFEAVSKFQEKYNPEVLNPWGLDSRTGYVYITTKKKVNEIYCKNAFPLTDEQKKEIESYKGLIEKVKQGEITVPESEIEKLREQVGQAPVAEEVVVAQNAQNEQKEKVSTSTIAAGINLAAIQSQTQNVEANGTISRIADSAAIFFSVQGKKLLYVFLAISVFLASFFIGILWQRRKEKKEKAAIFDPFSSQCLR